MSRVKAYPIMRQRRGSSNFKCRRGERLGGPVLLLFAAAGGLFAYRVGGCTSGPPPTEELPNLPQPRQPGPETAAPNGVVAVVDGQPVTWADLRPALMEAAGAVALEEAILDRALDRELAGAGLEVTEADIRRERELLVEAMTRDARTDPDEAERLITDLRRARALGEARFAGQLARTAKLRKLVAGTVSVTDEELRTAHEMRHGRSYRTRVIVVPDEREAAKIWSELDAPKNPQDLPARFAEAATKSSRDPSAPRGGLLGPVSPSDPTYPAAMRSLLETLPPGTMSPVVGLERGYAIVLVEERIEGDGTTFEQAAPALRQELTLRRERLAMDDLARRLLTAARVSVQDKHLRWSWEARGR